MKIDIHVHTKKTKQGDAETREIDAQRFYEIISSTDVKIVAITNHNVFDLEQYNDFKEVVGSDFQIWPGVELDILEDGRRGHLLVIVCPESAKKLGETVTSVSKGKTPDNFYISIDDVLANFDSLNPIYVAHYKQKKPDLTDKDIERISEKTQYKNRVLKEATNSISAGIFLSHGHSSIYGSDVQNWNKYQKSHAKNLPDLRLPVESFEQFCLLLNKDNVAINTLLDKKHPEAITIKPFKEDQPFDLTVYDDINIFFGSKGTGKSDILKAIAKHYSSKGVSARRFESGSEKLHDVFDLSGKKLQLDLNDFDISYCVKEIDFLKKSQEVDVTSLSKYRQFFSASLTNKKANKILAKDFPKENVQTANRAFDEVNSVYERFIDFKNYLESEESLENLIKSDKLEKLIESIRDILTDLNKSRSDKFVNNKTVFLFNSFVEKLKKEISRKTGVPAKPSDSGFRDYALNRIEIEKSVNTIYENINKKINLEEEYVGNLDEKGQLYCKTKILIQDGSINDGDFTPLKKNVNKTPQKEFARTIKDIRQKIYTHKLFEKVAGLNAIEGVESIPTIIELLMFKKYFTIDSNAYSPSTGESSMILLHKELNEDKEVYVLDEPEKSLGNEYINNVIVPLIKEKAKLGKKIFIATHDANIAVRTLPYNSIYRYHGQEGYETYIGNPFLNYLVNINDTQDKKDWKDVSMRTLEGGRDAFGERGQIYGKV